MKRQLVHLRLVFLLLAVFLLMPACSFNGAGQPPATVTPGSNLPVVKETSGSHKPPPAPPQAHPPVSTETFTLALTKTIQHIATPSGPSETNLVLTDINSQPTAAQGRAPGGDDFQTNQYERPFLMPGMVYLPDVDITKAEISLAAPWVYVTIYIVGPRPEGVGHTLYGVELDTNQDNRGEYLIWGASPASTDWTTNGVQIWMDSNGDVGGPTPQIADGVTSGDGYDKKLFDNGKGTDPDMAWIRQGPSSGQIQLAFKYSAINSAPKFFWNAIADFSMKKPALFDLNDHFTLEQAGLPLSEAAMKANYPLKQLFGMDNTCRDPFGFEANGDEPGLCEQQPVVLMWKKGGCLVFTGKVENHIPKCIIPCPHGMPNIGPC